MSEFKRVETDQLRNDLDSSNRFATSTGADDDLAQRLRNLGARVRKNVTEGYRTTPSSFSRAQTTGAIFQSMNDTMRDVYATTSRDVGPETGDARALKRSRSFEASKDAQTVDEEAPNPQPSADMAPRAIRPLRTTSRPFLATQSMPVGSFQMGVKKDQENTANGERVSTTIEEDDWSGENITQPFQPMTLE